MSDSRKREYHPNYRPKFKRTGMLRTNLKPTPAELAAKADRIVERKAPRGEDEQPIGAA